MAVNLPPSFKAFQAASKLMRTCSSLPPTHCTNKLEKLRPSSCFPRWAHFQSSMLREPLAKLRVARKGLPRALVSALLVPAAVGGHLGPARLMPRHFLGPTGVMPAPPFQVLLRLLRRTVLQRPPWIWTFLLRNKAKPRAFFARSI